jgi:hypothetical protein
MKALRTQIPKLAQQEMLRTHVIVVQRPGLFLCPDHNQPSPVSEPHEHALPPPFTLIPAPPRPMPRIGRVNSCLCPKATAIGRADSQTDSASPFSLPVHEYSQGQRGAGPVFAASTVQWRCR